MEIPQITKYKEGEFYNDHYDAVDKNTEDGKLFCKGGGQRICTCIIYLNDNFEGGTTYFRYICFPPFLSFFFHFCVYWRFQENKHGYSTTARKSSDIFSCLSVWRSGHRHIALCSKSNKINKIRVTGVDSAII